MPAEDEVAPTRLRVPDGAADLDEARAGSVEPRLGQPRRRDAEQFRDLSRMQQGIDFVGLGGGAHGPPPFVPGDGPKMPTRLPQKERSVTPTSLAHAG